MESSLFTRFKHAWNAFRNKDPTSFRTQETGVGYYYRPDRPRLTRGNERSIVTAVLNRIAIDCAAIEMRHVRLDENERYLETMDTTLNECLTVKANIDQTGRDFMRDVVLSLLDEGSVAIVPTDTDIDPSFGGSFKVYALRTGKIVEWYPRHIRVEVYNERIGRKEEVILPKTTTAIVENPFYAVMNEPNSTMQRLVRKLGILDVIDEQSGSGKLDLIVQVPYGVRSELRKSQANDRRKEIEDQLAGTKYGIAYIDGTERIVQLNRPIENNLMGQIEYLTNLFFSQLGITQGILDGSADEKTLLNYYNRIVEPILSAISDAMYCAFLSKTARSQGQSIEYFRDPFKLVPVSNLAEISDKMTRNEIMTSNEVRQILGMKPSSDPNADELRNKNLSAPSGNMPPTGAEENPEEGGEIQNEM
jgi:hypothetical protein